MDKNTKVIIIGSARATSATIAGEEYYFLYDGEALFALQDEFGACILPELSLQKPGGANNILRVSEILTERGAQKCKKYCINDVPAFKREIFDEIDFLPYMLLDLQKACGDAADIGFVREIDSDTEEVDLILLKHQKKRDIKEQSTSKTE